MIMRWWVVGWMMVWSTATWAQSTGVLQGTVYDDVGLEVPVAVLTLSREGAPDVQTEGDSRGRYRFEDLIPGVYRLLGAHPALGSTSIAGVRIAPGEVTVQDVGLASDDVEVIDVTHDQVLDVESTTVGQVLTKEFLDRIGRSRNCYGEVSAAGTIEVSVYDVEGRPVRGARVVLPGAGGTRETASGKDGVAVVDGLQPGPYTVRIEGPDDGLSTSVLVEVSAPTTHGVGVVLVPSGTAGIGWTSDWREAQARDRTFAEAWPAKRRKLERQGPPRIPDPEPVGADALAHLASLVDPGSRRRVVVTTEGAITRVRGAGCTLVRAVDAEGVHVVSLSRDLLGCRLTVQRTRGADVVLPLWGLSEAYPSHCHVRGGRAQCWEARPSGEL